MNLTSHEGIFEKKKRKKKKNLSTEPSHDVVNGGRPLLTQKSIFSRGE